MAEDFIPNSTINYINKAKKDITKSLVGSLVKKYANEIDDGVKAGLSSKQIAENLRKKDSSIKSKTIANTIARTLLHGAYARGSITDMLDDEMIVAFRFNAVNDSRVSDICESLDGKIISKDEVYNFLPPLHYNCRSVLEPIFINENIPPDKLINKDTYKTKEYQEKIEPLMKKQESFLKYQREDIELMREEVKQEVKEPEVIKPTDKIAEIKDYIANNKITNHIDAIKIGKQIDDVIKETSTTAISTINNLKNKIKEYENTSNDAYIKYKNKEGSFDDVIKYDDLKKEAVKQMKNANTQFFKDLVKDIIIFNSDVEQQFSDKTTDEFKNFFKQVSNIIPKIFLDVSASQENFTIAQSNGRSETLFNGDINIDIDSPTIFKTFIHEFMHRNEILNKNIVELEKKYYESRTQNDTLERLNQIPGYEDLHYSDIERVKKDNWLNAYMGKDYRGRAFEILSMAIPSILLNEGLWDINTLDLETRHFALGILSGAELEVK